MRSLKTAAFVLVLSLLATTAQAIQLQELIDRVRRNHPFFQKEELTVDVARSVRETLLPRYEWRYSLLPQYGVFGGPSATGFLEALTQSAELQALAQRGFADGKQLALSASTRYSWARNPLPGDDADLFQHGVQASLLWPLKKNLQRLARLGYDLEEYAVRAAEAEKVENLEAFLLLPAALFVDWAHALALAEIYAQRLQFAEEQLNTTNRMFRANLVERLDVLRAEDAIRTARQAIFEYQSQAKSIQAVLATLADSKELYDETPDFDLYSRVELPDAAEAAARARAATRLKEPLQLLIEQLKRLEELFAERQKATLDLSLGAGVSGPEDAFVDSLEIIYPQASVGLSYSPPGGLEGLAAERRLADTQVRQLEKEVQNLEKTVETNVTSLVIQAAELEKVIDLSRQLIESAEQKAAEEARLYGQGRNMLTNVILARDAVQAQKAKLADDFARYHHIIVEYRALMDELLQQAGR